MKKMQHVVIGERSLRVTEVAVETYIGALGPLLAAVMSLPALGLTDSDTFPFER